MITTLAQSKDNLIGISKRSKYRLRWYGEFAQQHSDEIYFEIKSRVNRTVHKTREKFFKLISNFYCKQF